MINSWEVKLYQILDRIFIIFYRFIPDPAIAFFIGTFIVAFIAVLVGEFSISIAFLVNRRHVEHLNDELVKWNNLSIEAIENGDKQAYKACNDQANNAFGKLFFISVAYSAACLWPVPFALGWMQYRFAEVELPIPVKLPFIDTAVGYTFAFILLYIVAKIIFSYLKFHLPYFKNIEAMLANYEKGQVKMRSFAELFTKKDTDTLNSRR